MAQGRASVPPRHGEYPPQTQTIVLPNGAAIAYDPNTPIGMQIKYAQYQQATTGIYPLPAASILQQDDKFRATWLDVHLPIPCAPSFQTGQVRYPSIHGLQPQPDPMQLSTLLEAMGLEIPTGQGLVLRKGQQGPRRPIRPRNLIRTQYRRMPEGVEAAAEDDDDLTEEEKADDGLGEEVDSQGEETPREEKTEEETDEPGTPCQESVSAIPTL